MPGEIDAEILNYSEVTSELHAALEADLSSQGWPHDSRARLAQVFSQLDKLIEIAEPLDSIDDEDDEDEDEDDDEDEISDSPTAHLQGRGDDPDTTDRRITIDGCVVTESELTDRLTQFFQRGRREGSRGRRTEHSARLLAIHTANFIFDAWGSVNGE